MNDPPPFATLNVDSGWQTYENFIISLRQSVADPGRYSHGRPVLPPQEQPPTNWIDIILQTGNGGDRRRLRLRLRRSNLYVDGFRDEDGTSWYEFNERRDSPHLIPNSIFLGFDGNYGSLEQTGRRADIALGQSPLRSAIHQLASLRGQIDTEPDKLNTMRSLIVAVQMISESARFLYISNYLVSNYNWVNGCKPDSNMINYENGWRALSEALLHDDQDPHWGQSWRLRHNNIMGINDAAAAVAIIAILLYRQIPGPSRQKREIEPAPWDDYPHGQALVEVFWLRIDNIDGEDPGDLYGTITAVDGEGSQYIFNQDRSDPYLIRPGNYALITGPQECISAADSVTLNVDLWDYDSWSPDDKIAQGTMLWNPYSQNEYDKPVTWEISGDYGSATLYYVVLSNAAQAIVEIVLINGDGEDPADVYGSITTNNGYGDSELFRKKDEENIPVRPGDDIPLLRNAIAVPMDGSLSITALLYDHDTFSADDEIANGTTNFNPQIFQSQQKYITGRYGKIEVRVRWT